MNWYATKSAGRGQGLVIDDTDGCNVAVVYDEKDTALLASAPNLLAAAKHALNYVSGITPNRHKTQTAYYLREAIEKAEG